MTRLQESIEIESKSKPEPWREIAPLIITGTAMVIFWMAAMVTFAVKVCHCNVFNALSVVCLSSASLLSLMLPAIRMAQRRAAISEKLERETSDNLTKDGVNHE